MTPPTRTDDTVTKYLTRASQLMRRACDEFGLAPNVELRPLEFVDWAIEIRPSVCRSSWRQYKASIRCYLEHQKSLEAKEALERLNIADCSPCKQKTLRTSAQKQRAIRDNDWKAIREDLLKRRSAWAKPTVVWLAATQLFGLRPSEWPLARLEEKQGGARFLIVRNGKNTNGRAHGDVRTLDVSFSHPVELEFLRLHLAFIGQFTSAAAYRRAYNACRKLLHRCTRALFPGREKYICLYSGRHQFSANAKKVLTRSEVATVMGHASNSTTGRHYARKKSARGKFRLRPIPAEVERIREKAVSRDERLARMERETHERADTTPHRLSTATIKAGD